MTMKTSLLIASLISMSVAPAMAETLVCKTGRVYLADKFGRETRLLKELSGKFSNAVIDGDTLVISTPGPKQGTLKCQPPKPDSGERLCIGTTADGISDTAVLMPKQKKVVRVTKSGEFDGDFLLIIENQCT